MTALVFSQLPSVGHSYCYQGTGFDFASAVNKSLDYLLCLHNEQANSLNEQARIINGNSDLISQNARIFNDAMDRQSNIKRALDSLTFLVTEMDRDQSRLRNTLEDLEARISELEYGR
ncbi:hypothetical protein [Yoonia sp.]|uniref:hypothetical protein n=1 Tax=Yoonia sp. TaxID=2212373 RepID=UPI0025E04026|nr:hypothetical protein [Yoonia sp.]